MGRAWLGRIARAGWRSRTGGADAGAPEGRRLEPRTAGWRLVAVAAAVTMATCGDPEPPQDTEATPAPSLPDRVRVADPGLHPEGIEYDEAGERFLISSITRGTVTSVEDDGSWSVFIEDPDIVSSIGIHIDDARGRLLVASSDASTIGSGGGPAMLGAYDLESGDRIFMVDLAAVGPGEGHFANDVAVGPDGTAYVTDSLQPVIYAVTPDGEASVFVQGGALTEGGFLNGIDYHPGGFLLVAQAGAGALLRVDLGEEPEVTIVSLPEPVGADGLTLTPEGALVVVAPVDDGSETLLLESSDGWASATIAGRQPVATNATTAAVRDGSVYVLDARFGDMGGPEPAPHFDISRVPLS